MSRYLISNCLGVDPEEHQVVEQPTDKTDNDDQLRLPVSEHADHGSDFERPVNVGNNVIRFDSRFPSRERIRIPAGRVRSRTTLPYTAHEAWLGAESNRRHVDFQSTALPTELPSRDGVNRVPPWGFHYATMLL